MSRTFVIILTKIRNKDAFLYILIRYLQGAAVPGLASTVGVFSLLFGILFVLLGCIGIYLADIHSCLKNRPAFIIEKSENMDT